MTQEQPTTRRDGRTTPLALTAIAVLLGLNLLRPIDPVPTAAAQPAAGGGLASAAEQRKQMMTQLTSIERHLEKLEAQITKGIRVAEMPELKLPAELKEALRAAARAERNEKSEKPEPAPK